MVRQTSIQAYYAIKNLGKRQKMVLKAIKKLEKPSNLDISKELSWPINCVTGRTNELLRLGYIYTYRKKVCKYSNRRVMIWEITENVKKGVYTRTIYLW